MFMIVFYGKTQFAKKKNHDSGTGAPILTMRFMFDESGRFFSFFATKIINFNYYQWNIGMKMLTSE